MPGRSKAPIAEAPANLYKRPPRPAQSMLPRIIPKTLAQELQKRAHFRR